MPGLTYSQVEHGLGHHIIDRSFTMVDSIKIVVRLADQESAPDHEACKSPFLIGQQTNQAGEVVARFYDWDIVESPLTGAGFRFRAISIPGRNRVEDSRETLGPVLGYELEANVAACLNGLNHALVNGVPRASEAALELLKYGLARRGCTRAGLQRLRQKNVTVRSITCTFLLEFDSAAQALERLRELRNHAEGVLNHVSPSAGSKKKSKAPCYSVGPDDYFTIYIKQREFKVRAYIKQPDVPKAFKNFPSQEVRAEVEQQALRTLRVEVSPHESWLLKHDLTHPDKWRTIPATAESAAHWNPAYGKVFQLVRGVLRLDECLRTRAPTDYVIQKLPPAAQEALRSHLAGRNLREPASSSPEDRDRLNKKFSELKRLCLPVTRVDLSLPWQVQSTLLSADLQDWFEYEATAWPTEGLLRYVFSPASVPAALEALRAETERVLAASAQTTQASSSRSGSQELQPRSAEDKALPLRADNCYDVSEQEERALLDQDDDNDGLGDHDEDEYGGDGATPGLTDEDLTFD
jgi:hypothetical protein